MLKKSTFGEPFSDQYYKEKRYYFSSSSFFKNLIQVIFYLGEEILMNPRSRPKLTGKPLGYGAMNSKRSAECLIDM